MSRTQRQWVKLHTGVVSDDAFLDLSTPAKTLYLMALAKAGLDGTDGVVPCSVRSVVRWTGMEPDEAEAAIAELAGAGFWTCNGAEASIRNWDRYQPTNGEIGAKREAAASRVARHREKKRETQAQPAPETKPEMDAADVRKRLWQAMSRAISDEMDGQVAVSVYRKLYDDAVTAGSDGGKYAEVKGIGPAILANLVVSHAACRWLGVEGDDPALRRLHALRRDHGTRVIELLPDAAVKAKGDPVNYLTAMLNKGGAK